MTVTTRLKAECLNELSINNTWTDHIFIYVKFLRPVDIQGPDEILVSCGSSCKRNTSHVNVLFITHQLKNRTNFKLKYTFQILSCNIVTGDHVLLHTEMIQPLSIIFDIGNQLRKTKNNQQINNKPNGKQLYNKQIII